MRVAYLGPRGTFTQEAALLFPDLSAANLTPLNSIPEVLNELKSGQVNRAVVPLENTIAGPYKPTVLGLEGESFREVTRVTMPIVLAIGIHPDSTKDRVTEIRSMNTALEECDEYLDAHFGAARRVVVNSTALAMEMISSESILHVAAVGSVLGMNEYQLKMLEVDIGNPVPNETTFLLLERSGN